MVCQEKELSGPRTFHVPNWILYVHLGNVVTGGVVDLLTACCKAAKCRFSCAIYIAIITEHYYYYWSKIFFKYIFGMFYTCILMLDDFFCTLFLHPYFFYPQANFVMLIITPSYFIYLILLHFYSDTCVMSAPAGNVL